MTLAAPWPSEAHALKCELAAEALLSSGRVRLQVTGWSMLPSIWPGDVLVIDRCEAAEILKGDIVLYRSHRRLVVHRVVRVRHGQERGGVFTRGDAMPDSDAPVSEPDLLGRVSWILRGGQRITPRPSLSIAEHAIALLVRHSRIAAKLVVRMHDFLANSSAETSTLNNRAISCQN
jgi:signal peptidase I